MKQDIREHREMNLDSLVGSNEVGDLHRCSSKIYVNSTVQSAAHGF
jgi:hypothetical protein